MSVEKSNVATLSEQRFLQLDSLRGIAASIVMLHHYFFIYDRDYGHSFKVPYFFAYGFYGVELFFIISGFVIYYTLQKSYSAKHFLIKRFIRLFPTYWFCLALTFLVVGLFPLIPERNTTIGEAIANVTMLNGLFRIKPVDPSYWTLMIELFFYLLINGIFVIYKSY